MMLQITEKEIELRLRLDNPWWEAGGGIDPEYRGFPRRSYLNAFHRLVRQVEVNRAVVLLGRRRHSRPGARNPGRDALRNLCCLR